MSPAGTPAATTQADTAVISLRTLIQPILRSWRLVIGIPLLAGFLVGLYGLVMPRKYQATVVLAGAGGGRGLGALGSLAGAAAMLGGANLNQGLQATPELVVALISSRRVRQAVGDTPIGAGGPTIVEALSGKPVEPTEVPRAMGKFVDASISRENGLVTMRVRHRDSALVRTAADALLHELRRGYADAARQQAAEQRAAQELRVDSAYRRLDRSEDELQGFIRRNRVVNEYSVERVRLERLTRDLDIARQVYLQAVTDREAAAARELQDLPAVVVVDPVPSELPFVPRLLALKVALALAASFLLVIATVLVRESWTREAT